MWTFSILVYEEVRTGEAGQTCDSLNVTHKKVKVKWSRYRPGVAQGVGRGIALLFHDRGTRRGWVVSSTPRPQCTHGKDPVPILQEAGWAPGPVWTGEKSRPHRDSIPDRPALSQSLYRLSSPAHKVWLSCHAKSKRKEWLYLDCIESIHELYER